MNTGKLINSNITVFWRLCTQALVAIRDKNYLEAMRLLNIAEFRKVECHLPQRLLTQREEYLVHLKEYASSFSLGEFSLLQKSPLNNIHYHNNKLDSSENITSRKIGIAVFAHTRASHLQLVLESISKQNALDLTEVWIDGHQGLEALRLQVEKTISVAQNFHVKKINTQKGQYGFRKMLILALLEMTNDYDDLIILEDDCFPTQDAIDVFVKELENIRHQPEIFSVYGHHFMVEQERETCARFQGWGWGSTSEKLRPILNELLACYLMNESDYLDFVGKVLTPEIKQKIDVTPGRQPSSVLTEFFAWDETICLLTALHGYVHKPTYRRVIYNFGMGNSSTHFPENDRFRKPPFNLISQHEVWQYFRGGDE